MIRTGSLPVFCLTSSIFWAVASAVMMFFSFFGTSLTTPPACSTARNSV